MKTQNNLSSLNLDFSCEVSEFWKFEKSSVSEVREDEELNFALTIPLNQVNSSLSEISNEGNILERRQSKTCKNLVYHKRALNFDSKEGNSKFWLKP